MPTNSNPDPEELWLTNTANTRVFNLAVPGAQMKLVGGDSGRVEHEQLVSEVLLAPSERAVVDVAVDQPGERHLEHHTPDRTYPLATVTVAERVKIRLVNEMESDHPMHHPFHLHGAGRFLVLARDGMVEDNLVLKDTGWSVPARSWTSCSTSPTPGCGWPIAISPSTCRAA